MSDIERLHDNHLLVERRANPQVNILLVDDHEPNLVALEVILDSPDYNLIKASSGAEALRLYAQHEFAAVLLDVQMPIMDGFETARRIRAAETTHHTPIVFVTAIDRDNAYAERGYEVGAIDYIVKPINPKILKPKIDFFTASHRNRERLAALEGERSFQVLADAAPVMIWIADGDQQLAWSNKAWIDFTGRSTKVPNPWCDLIHPEDFERWLLEFRQAFARREGFKIDYRLRHASGSYRWVLDHGIPHDVGGTFRGFIGSCVDIEDQKQAIRARDEFLSIASHELKTPVTSLKLQLQMLGRHLHKPGSPVLTTSYLANLAEIGNRQINQLVSLIDDMLDVSRISTGHLTFDMQDADLSAVLQDVVASFESQIRAADVSLRIHCEQALPVRCDRRRIEQVVCNLLTNALKYGMTKPVEIRGWCDGDRIKMSVRDHGMGISPENQKRIFERFERAVSPATVSGLGLGLYISRQIMSAHQGGIEVRSESGQGAEFTCWLPRLNDNPVR